MHFFDMCRTERRRLFNISICGKTILIAVCVLAMGVLTFINENPNIKITDKYFYELFRLYFSRGTFFQLLFVPVGYYIMYGICTDLKEKSSSFWQIQKRSWWSNRMVWSSFKKTLYLQNICRIYIWTGWYRWILPELYDLSESIETYSWKAQWLQERIE